MVPSAPVLVPELAPGAAAELAQLRAAVLDAAEALPDRWIAVGVDRSEAIVGPAAAGTFAGYGVDVRVALSSAADGRIDGLPLCALIAAWLRGRANPDAHVQVRVYGRGLDVDGALTRGRELRAEIDAAAGAVGVLVVADGAHTLTPPAPGGYDPDSLAVQAALDDALAGGDADALTRLPETIVGRVAYQVLAGLAGQPRSAKEMYRGAPYGVGYFVGVWQP
jgi:hypothetical protein